MLQALTYGKRAPILEVLQENNQQSLDTADLGRSGYISESEMMPSLQQRRKACGSKYFLKSSLAQLELDSWIKRKVIKHKLQANLEHINVHLK